MKNIFSYLKQQGNFTFEEVEFNEIDNLVFCALSYIHFDTFIQKEEVISLKDLYTKYQSIMDKNNIFKINQNYLFELVSRSKRFKDILLSYYVNEIDVIEEKQFCAMTFILPDGKLFVAFKGTDETVIGWKEDFDMSYQVVPSQKRACSYLDEILKNTKKEVFVGGHSKGGNLAMYAAIFCSDELKSKLTKVYNNDGPGFIEDIQKKEEYQSVKNKIISYIPKASLVGNLFDYHTKTILIESDKIGILQHDLYSWLVSNNHFVYVSEMDIHTKKLSNTLNKIIKTIPKAQKKRIVTFLYDALTSFHIYDLESTIESILKKYHLEFEDIILLKKILPFIIQIIKNL